jgi:hypothetical protein
VIGSHIRQAARAPLLVSAINNLVTSGSLSLSGMKKRREMLDAMREDARISTLEGKLQRVSSEAEAYRRFAERESLTASGSKNQAEQSKTELEQLRLALEEERARSSALSAELSACKALVSERATAEVRAARLESELSSATAALRAAEARAEALSLEALRAVPAPAPSEDSALSSSVAPRTYSSGRGLGAGVANSAAERVQSLENDLRLSQLALKAAERQLERERRSAERAGAEADEARALLAGVRREQQVKDLQLDTMRADLQEMLCGGGAVGLAAAPPTPRASSSMVPALQLRRGPKQLADAAQREREEDKNEDEDEAQDIGEVLAEEMASMKSSYDSKVSKLEDELQSARNELKELLVSARANLF